MTRKNKHEGHARKFIIMSQAWYGDASRQAEGANASDDEILLGFYPSDGGTSGEFSIRWRDMRGKSVPYLRAYDDSWSALAGFADVIEALKNLDNTNPTVERVAAVLLACGVQDATPRENPHSRTREDVQAVATLLTIHTQAFEQIRDLGREMSQDPNWAAGYEHNQGVLYGTKLVPRPVVDELVRAMSMADVYRTKLRMVLNECKDPEVVAQFKSLAYPPQL